jgi:nitroimidazol reductase NimA-like FMN-containing flavoprotein (pyridoxamine 5'-phosphate oxidase superfamily)
MIGDLNETQMVRILQTEAVGRIGCYAEDRTYVVPVAYAYAGGYIYCHSGLGMKIEMMRANPQVCFEVDHIEDLANWQSVIAWGTYEELDEEAAEDAMRILVERLTPLISGKSSGLPHPWNGSNVSTEHVLHRASRHGVVYRIRITEKTGRYEKR